MYPMYGINNNFNPYNNITNPQINNFQPAQNNLIRVTGLDGAKAYQMRPNSVVALFDGAEDIFYLKSTDGAGFPTIRIFRFEEVTSTPNVSQEYITKAEFEQFKEEVLNGKQYIQESEQ